MEVAFVFPGQGSQCLGMGREIASRFPSAKAVFDLADEVLDFGVSAACWEDNGLLERTEVTQPALLTVELACLAAVLESGVRPAMAAGHSLGEYAALVAAGMLDTADALRLVRARGVITGEVAREAGGGMAALMGMDAEALERLLASVPGVLEVSNYNAPGQVVISGEARALEEAVEKAGSYGARRVVELAVSGPFHSPLMRPAAQRFAVEVAALDLKPASVPVISNFDATAHRDPGTIARNLVSQLFHPVRWEESVARMSSMGADLFLEIGPGRVLEGLIRRCSPGARVASVGDPDGLARAVEALERGGPVTGGVAVDARG